MTQTRTACRRCGAPLDTGARFCQSCGAESPDPTRPSAKTTPIGQEVTRQVRRGNLLEGLRDATLGEYEILTELGSGGMATVFLAHDLQLDRRVAIKLMHPALLTGEGMIERFILEARTAAGLSHPNIIPIYAVKDRDEQLFFVMKFVEGRPLDSIIRKEAPLPAPMVRQILSKLAEALGYAHGRGVIHRDIKPANIMISTEGQPILTDFGIAKVADKEGLTMTGATIGTPFYMSPEQCNAQPLTGASDQYSLGVMAYEMLTGRPPFDAESVMTIMYKHLHEPPAPLRTVAKNCPEDLAAVVERMLAKKPSDRFPNMDEAAHALLAPDQPHDKAVQTRLVQLAMEGGNQELLKRVSTPRSPIPTTVRSRRQRGQTPPAPPVPAPPKKKSRVGLLIAVLVVVGGGAALAFTRPWERGAALPAGEDSSLTMVPGGTALPAPVAADTQATADTTPVNPVQSPTQEPVTPPSRSATPPSRNPSRPPAATTPARVTSVVVSGATSLSVGGSARLQAEARSDQGVSLAGRTVSWNSSAPAVVSVTQAGQITALATGRAVITATADNVSGSLTVTVADEPVGSVSVVPTTVTLDAGDTVELSAIVKGTTGRALDRPVEWSSSAPAVASVSSTGSVTGLAPGSAVITAASEGYRAAASVTVRRAAPTDADLRAQAVMTIQTYAAALESRDVSRVRQIFVGMTTQREQQLRQALPDMQNLQVRLTVADVQLSGDRATVRVTGSWSFLSGGQRNTLAANNTYQLERRSGTWVISEIL
ncbi:MAG: protein kinase [Gemmatimonadales bacterium]